MTRPLVCLTLVLGALAGCDGLRQYSEGMNVFRDRTNDYLEAKRYPALAVPEGFTPVERDISYPLPPSLYAVPSEPADITPPDFSS